jgi:uncharacterized membrane protein HdeD (DUF308 family)
MGALAEVKTEWKHFRHDAPGQRFRNHRERMKDKPGSHSLVAIVIGVLLVVGGIVLLFIPGPGSLLIVFGFALIASHSKKLSGMMDRTEPKLRRIGRRGMRRWKAMPGRAKLSVILALGMLAVAAGLGAWKYVVGAYLLG